MFRASDIRRSAVERLKELFARATAWEEVPDFKTATQSVDLLVRFKMGPTAHTLALEISSLGQPRQVREAVAKLAEFHREMPDAYPVAVAPYIGPHSAALVRRQGF